MMKSSCCGAEINTVIGDRVIQYSVMLKNLGDVSGKTCYWQCDACKQPCDAKAEIK